jgi:hypothetical protein
MDEFENFEAKAFVGRLLGKGDWTGFMDKIKVLAAFTVASASVHECWQQPQQKYASTQSKACESFSANGSTSQAQGACIAMHIMLMCTYVFHSVEAC